MLWPKKGSRGFGGTSTNRANYEASRRAKAALAAGSQSKLEFDPLGCYRAIMKPEVQPLKLPIDDGPQLLEIEWNPVCENGERRAYPTEVERSVRSSSIGLFKLDAVATRTARYG
jgi:hypothetical protein